MRWCPWSVMPYQLCAASTAKTKGLKPVDLPFLARDVTAALILDGQLLVGFRPHPARLGLPWKPASAVEQMRSTSP